MPIRCIATAWGVASTVEGGGGEEGESSCTPEKITVLSGAEERGSSVVAWCRS